MAFNNTVVRLVHEESHLQESKMGTESFACATVQAGNSGQNNASGTQNPAITPRKIKKKIMIKFGAIIAKGNDIPRKHVGNQTGELNKSGTYGLSNIYTSGGSN